MQKLITRFALTAAVCLTAGIATAAQYPPGPTGLCTDSVTIARVQDLAATCHPATGDTVLGVGGIITGFDTVPTGFSFYMQNSQGGPFTGVEVFTHGTNFKPILGLSIGDSIVVEFARTAEFQNGTELLSPNNNFSAPNIVLRKVSSGNALPPYFTGTTTQLNVLTTNTVAEQYEGCLVRVATAMTVARSYLQNVTGGTTNMPFGTFYVVSPTAPSDSVMVDGAALFSFAPPPNGTAVTLVQGVMHQRTGGYRILLRDGNDIVVNTPPGVSDAYSISDTQVRVVFDRNVTTASATNTANYSLGSLGSVDAAVMDGQSNAILTINNGLGDGPLESVTINGITGLANGLTMTASATRNFINGALSCAEMSSPNPDTLALSSDCYDQSKYSAGGGRFGNGPFGPRSTLQGVCVGVFGNLFYLNDAGSPQRGGITVFAPPAPLVVGRTYTLAGAAQEFVGETEFAAIQYLRDDGPAATLTPPVVPISTITKQDCDITQTITTGEDFESMLVELPYAQVFRRFTPQPTNGFHIRGLTLANGDTIFVQNLNNVLGPNDSLNVNYPAYNQVVTIVGVVHQDGSFRVCPRNAADIRRHGIVDVPTSARGLTFSVFPNPARRATLSFSLPTETDIELGVYDVSGREIAQLAKGRFPAGSYTRGWAGATSTGGKVGAGVYFVRLKAGKEVRMTRTVMLGSN